MGIKIKKEHEKTRVAFGKSGKPLGERNDLHLIAEAAMDADGNVKDEHLAGYFEELPTLDEIKAIKEKNFKKTAPVSEKKEEEKTAPTKGGR